MRGPIEASTVLLTIVGAWPLPEALAAVTPAAPASAPAPAQAVATDTLPLATLSSWAEEIWLDLLDREGTIHGPVAQEGIFQRFHPRMDSEYALDVRTGLFTAAEDAAWAESDGGVRAAARSISYPHFLNRVDWAQAFPIQGSVELTAHYRRDHSLTDRRDYVRLGARWNEVGGSRWTAWSRIGMHFFKPAADVEVGATRSWPAGETGLWRLELRAAALDAFSDLVFVRLGVDPRDAEAHVDHTSPPVAARALLERRGARWRVEAQGGVTPTLRRHVTFPATGAEPFDLSERVWFAGTLVEAKPGVRLDLAAYARTARARTRHAYAPASASRNLRVTECTNALGGWARRRLGDALVAEAELHAVWMPETRAGPDGLVEHDDRQVFGGLALARRPAAGWTARAAYAVLDRDAGVLVPTGSARDHRLLTEAGYRSAAGFDVNAGIGWDLDALGIRTFDGGYVRLSALPFPRRSP